MRSKQFQELCNTYRTKLSYTALYYPRANQCERVNKTLKTMLAMYVKDNQRKWDENLPAIFTCAIRTCKSETTGYSLFYINFGREYIPIGDHYKYQLTEIGNKKSVTSVEQRQRGYQKMYNNVKKK